MVPRLNEDLKMASTKTYNGHKNKTHWNVSLWINNGESLYRLAQSCIAQSRTKDIAAECMYRRLKANGTTTTPDGFKYSTTAIRAAMVGM